MKLWILFLITFYLVTLVVPRVIIINNIVNCNIYISDKISAESLVVVANDQTSDLVNKIIK